MLVKNLHGFTIMELMVVVVIVGILAALAGPSFRGIMATSNVKAAASDLQMTLIRARSEAMKRNATVTVSPTAGWAGGWTIAGGIETHAAVQITIVGPDNVNYRPNGRTDAAGIVNFDISSPDTTIVRCVSIGLSGQPVTLPNACT